MGTYIYDFMIETDIKKDCSYAFSGFYYYYFVLFFNFTVKKRFNSYSRHNFERLKEFE